MDASNPFEAGLSPDPDIQEVWPHSAKVSFRELVENLNDALFSLNTEGRVEFISAGVERFTQYDPREIIGQSFTHFIHPDDLERLLGSFHETMNGKLSPAEFRVMAKNGGICHVRSSSRRRMEADKTVGINGVLTDITERVLAEIALREARAELERRVEERTRELMQSNLNLHAEIVERRRAEMAQAALYRISEATHAAQDLPSLFKQIHQILGELLPARSFYVALYNPQSEELSFPYFVDEFRSRPQPRKISNTLTDFVVRTGESLLISKEMQADFFRREKIKARREFPVDWLGVPLMAQRRTIGALAVQSYNPDVRYTENDKALLQFVSDQIATAVERTRAEQALWESELRFQRVADNTGEWIWETNQEGIYTYSNVVVEEMLGYKPEEIVGHASLSDLFAPEERSGLIRAVAEIHGKKQPFRGFISTMVHKDGRRVILETRGVPILDELGNLAGYRGTKTDITNRVRAERERHNLERKIQEAQRLESLGLLAGGIAHDFNNLLNAILGHLELAAQDLPQDSPVQTRLERAGKACHGAADLCRQMLAFSGRGRFMVKPMDLNEAVADIARMLEVSISKKADLVVKLEPDLPSIKADTSQLQQVLMNLVVNASEALEAQSGTITLRTGLIRAGREYLSTARMAEELPEGDYVFLEVTDTGCGMSPDTLSRVFDPFFTTKFTGRGLGLAAVMGIVRGHKGGVRVQSILGEGSSFTILFPASEPLASKPVASPPVESTWRGSGTVLLVDDEVVLREIGKEFLDRLGFETITACDGVEAIEVFRLHREKLTCILLDLTMPRMDGTETFRELRALGCSIPVIIVSGFAERDVADNLAGQGLSGFIQKPYTRATLVSKLAEVLGS